MNKQLGLAIGANSLTAKALKTYKLEQQDMLLRDPYLVPFNVRRLRLQLPGAWSVGGHVIAHALLLIRSWYDICVCPALQR